VNLIHKSDVYFDVIEPMLPQDLLVRPKRKMHHGEIYIYINEIYLYDGSRWYRADVRDIKAIKSSSQSKEILIQFVNFDLILSCAEYSHLLALRDFLYLAQKSHGITNIMMPEPNSVGGGN